MEATGDMLENKPILKSDENDVGERSCDLINGLTSKYSAGPKGRHGILIFSCLLFVLFEKICSIKSCHFSNHGILIEKTKPDGFLISP